jgi:hypothetical protein
MSRDENLNAFVAFVAHATCLAHFVLTEGSETPKLLANATLAAWEALEAAVKNGPPSPKPIMPETSTAFAGTPKASKPIAKPCVSAPVRKQRPKLQPRKIWSHLAKQDAKRAQREAKKAKNPNPGQDQ